MDQVKKFSTYDELLNKLCDRGCIINNASACIEVLKNIGYYRLSAYFYPFMQEDKTFVEKLSFDKVYRIYEFDRKLRNLLLTALEVIEISLRARLAHFHSEKYGPQGYLNASNFNKEHQSAVFTGKINIAISNNKKASFVRHYIEKHDRNFPLWVISELFTFGMLSRFYSELKTADKKAFAGVDHKHMVSWLKCCTDLRNICAHYGRLYCRVFPALPSGFQLSEFAGSRLWGAVLSVRALYPSTSEWNNEFMPALEALIEAYSEDIDLYHLGFPNDWEIRLRK